MSHADPWLTPRHNDGSVCVLWWVHRIGHAFGTVCIALGVLILVAVIVGKAVGV